MSSIPGLLAFIPVPFVPGVSLLPEPWLSASTEVKLAYAQTLAAFGDLEQLQQTRNMIAIEAGNKSCTGTSSPLGFYNGQVKRYWLNGGSNNKYGFTLPESLPVMEQFYHPAVDATLVYNPTTRLWVPSGQIIETPIWFLPPGTVLYTVGT